MPSSSDSGKKKILWVEDDDFIVNVLSAKLKAAGLELIHARNSEQALNMLTGTVVPDAVVLDLLLPGMDGFEFLRRMRADLRFGKIPVMVLSNLSKPEDWERVRKLGAKKFLVKTSVSSDKAVAEIRELCETDWEK